MNTVKKEFENVSFGGGISLFELIIAEKYRIISPHTESSSGQHQSSSEHMSSNIIYIYARHKTTSLFFL